MATSVKASIIKERSFDPNFYVKVNYEDGTVSFNELIVKVVRTPPKVSFVYPDEIETILGTIDQQRMELELLNCVVAHIMNNAGRSNIITPKL